MIRFIPGDILKDIIENKDPKHNPDQYNEMPIFRPLYDQLRGSYKMMKKNIILLIFSCSLYSNAYAINHACKEKYPYTVLTNDYGILKEKDLDSLRDGVRPPPFLPKKGCCYIYWQCFPRDKISIDLKDMGYSSKDIGGDENYSNLKITVSKGSGTFHEYTMRRVWPTSTYEENFNLWIKLMKDEKYVCLSGTFIDSEERILQGQKQKIYSWIFDKMKTKKGCDSYFTGD